MQVLGWLLVVAVVAYVAYRLTVGAGRDRRQAFDRDLASYESVERTHMPAEIAAGTLVASEQYFRTTVPRPLGAQVDQVYCTPDGLLVPVDTKRRFRKHVTAYDQIEVSVQACALRTGRPAAWRRYKVADYAYIRVTSEGRAPAYLAVKLLTDTELASLYDRYWKIRKGSLPATGAEHPALCRKCAYVSRCENALTG